MIVKSDLNTYVNLKYGIDIWHIFTFSNIFVHVDDDNADRIIIISSLTHSVSNVIGV